MPKCVQVNRNERLNPIRFRGHPPPLPPFPHRNLRPNLPDSPQKTLSPKTPPTAPQHIDSIESYTQPSVRNEFKTNGPQRPDRSYETQSRSGSDRLPWDPSRLPHPVRSQHRPGPAPETRFSTRQTAKLENENERQIQPRGQNPPQLRPPAPLHPNEPEDRAGNVLLQKLHLKSLPPSPANN